MQAYNEWQEKAKLIRKWSLISTTEAASGHPTSCLSAADITTVLNLLIVFTGIFGVVAFTLTKRGKEIAVRKVLGAAIKSIISIFLKEYGVLIAISNIIAWPLAYLATSKWLENYAYHIHQNLIPYSFVCLFIFLTAFILISLQCFKAALANPVKSLRSE